MSTCAHCGGWSCSRCKPLVETKRPPLVVAVASGQYLLWVENGRLWVSMCLSSWNSETGPTFGHWTELTDGAIAPGIGGLVLPAEQVARLQPPVSR